MSAAYSPAATRHFAARGIEPATAARVGVAERDGSLIFTVATETGSFQRTRRLHARGPAKVLQPRGRPLAIWWPLGRPEYAPTVLLVEGESDGLAALSALAARPVACLPAFGVGALPGAGFPAARVVEELRRLETRQAFLAFDGDAAGFRLTRAIGWELHPLGIRVAPVAIPEGQDLADVLAATEPARRGECFAEMLLDAESPAKAAA